ncbi:hypothetical protein [Hymenobacter glacieicola]|uniref:Uncharacterized protein n=1 Tax=Hymenobacter glacieicola TaxID=1562124 RepID=A0ABQ1X5C5_9BACT|nr:hypothetical protein [Hymenobacter glacieicola]GGG60740.1 hypothetical protein GCM10011378_40960 [Hymenobacter glacieicola]
MAQALYKFYKDCGRSGDLSGVFLSTPEKIEGIIGKGLYFYEVLGKHSEISFAADAKQFTLVTDAPEVIKVVAEHGLESGINPFEYLYDEEEEFDVDEDE